jgi:hypothetical protein
MTTMRQFSTIAPAMPAMPAMTGRVTMLGLSRWTAKGGSYRTVQRFFSTAIPWATLFWLFLRTHLLDPDDVYPLGGDETVVTKAGMHTHGLDRFFAGLYGRRGPGLACFTRSLRSTKQRRSFPMAVEQVVRPPAEKAAARATTPTTRLSAPAPKRTPGRPQGSTTQAKPTPALTPERSRIQPMVLQLRQRIEGPAPLTYLVLDGHFGNNAALHMAQRCTLHLLRTLRCDSALYLPYAGPYAGRGPKRIYGDKYRSASHCGAFSAPNDGRRWGETRIYQRAAHHKTVAQPVNVVVMVKTNVQTQAQAHGILFRSDRALSWDKLIDYSGLRFQLEVNFRDATQDWGVEDCMNIRPTAVLNAANLSRFMVNRGERVVQDSRGRRPKCSVLGRKAHGRGAKYVEETITMLPETPEPIVLERIFTKIVGIGRIHAALADPVSA